jgi:hypothetical protein
MPAVMSTGPQSQPKLHAIFRMKLIGCTEALFGMGRKPI